ncbi:putative leucine-rich repeat-containing protein DDB_G0290503 [Prorops nasuta]|uniref:putative leucine-rich repeat-containing protein DDB_G0290503 n=1 Tax=Prorops nasuta TaxID=863751 RepID=UPI0034CF69E3
MAYKSQSMQDEVEMETIAEAELSRLKRQYRIMENDRAAYAEDARLQQRNQQNMIKRLEFEKAELLLAIKSAKSPLNAMKDAEMEEKLRCLLDKRKKYIEIIKDENKEIADINDQIKKTFKEVAKLRMKVQTDAQAKEAALKQQRLVSILENRLEVITKRFNEVVANNAKLRNEIDALLKERTQFNCLWNKLSIQLNIGKQIISDLIEQATAAFNQRDEELSKIYTLKERGLRDLKGHALEMCELQRTLNNEMKLQEFLGVKGQYREMGDLNAKKEAERRAKYEEKQNQIATYIKILKQIKEFSGEKDIDKLTVHFTKQEEENFALFNYVNELNDELESLQSKVSELRASIDEARAANANRSKEKTETLEKLEQQLQEQTRLADEAELDLSKKNDYMDRLLKRIETLFRTLRCDSTPILDLLGDEISVTTSNVMLYLGVIEKQIVDTFGKTFWVDKASKSKQLRLDVDNRTELKVPFVTRVVPSYSLSKDSCWKLDLEMLCGYAKILCNISKCQPPTAGRINHSLLFVSTIVLEFNLKSAHSGSMLFSTMNATAHGKSRIILIYKPYILIMQNDKVAPANEPRLKLLNQQKMIKRLEFEKAELLLAIKSAKSPLNATKDADMEEKLRCRLAERKKFIEILNEEKKQVAELDEQIKKTFKEVAKLRMKVQDDARATEAALKQQKSVNILETRLEAITKRFHEVVATNANYRDEIDALLKERAQFNSIWSKLSTQLNAGKQIINDLIEQATVAFNQRDEEISKIYSLKESPVGAFQSRNSTIQRLGINELGWNLWGSMLMNPYTEQIHRIRLNSMESRIGRRDLKSHTLEMRELQRTLNNEMKLQEFLGVKGQYREMSDLNAKKEADRRATIEEKKNKIATYTHILKQIKEFAGEKDIDKLTMHFIKQEEENFALFNYVNDLNEELESLQSKVNELRAAIDEARVANASRQKEQTESLEKLEQQLDEQTRLADEAELDLSEKNDYIERLLKGIEALFRTLKCDTTQIPENLGDEPNVTAENVMQYLGIIEKQIVDMFNKVYWADKASKSKHLRLDEENRPELTVPSITRVVPTQPCSLCVEKEEMLIVTDGLEVPLSKVDAAGKLDERFEVDYAEILHNVSKCQLPAARRIIQKRYQ